MASSLCSPSSSSMLWLPLLFLQAAAEPYAPQSPHQCRNPQTEHYVEAIKKCCRSCPPGFRVLRACTESADTQCESCNEGMYTTAWSQAERCFSCVPPCKAGFVEVRACTRTQNRYCWCPPNQFCKVKLPPTCFQCAQFQTCGKGYGVTKPGTNVSDVQCAPCEPGTFSDVESSTAACVPHKRCKSVMAPGNSTHDTVCSGMMGIATRSPHNSGRSTKGHPSRPPSPPPSKNPMLAVKKEDVRTDLSSKAGWAAGGMFALLALIAGTLLFVAFRNKHRNCALPLGKNEKLFALIGKGPQRRIPPSNGNNSVDRNGTHVNVNCIVSVCRSGRALESHLLKGSDPEFRSVAEDEIPLSEEEGRGDRKQMAVEVEDDTDSSECGEEKLPPLSVQDIGMKST